MLEKIKDLAKRDPLFYHKVGLVGGVAVALLAGLVISDRADKFIEVTTRLEETDGKAED